MQINQAKFLDNGQCGFLLRPQFMFKDGELDWCPGEVQRPPSPEYLPSDPGAPGVAGVAAMDLSVRVIAGRHIMKTRGIASPFVEVEVIGADYDCVKHKTKVVQDNGFNPVWDESFNLRILNPDLAMLRFCVYDEDMFGDPNFLGSATFPARCLRAGFRSVPLRNGYSEELELSGLLVQLVTKQVDTGSSLAVMLSRAEVGPP
jgi:phosphatidylinositol phospholipase C gamma-1